MELSTGTITFLCVGSAFIGVCLGWVLHYATGRRYTLSEALERKIRKNNQEQLAAALGNKEIRAKIEAEKQRKLDERKYIKDCITAEMCPICQSPIKLADDGLDWIEYTCTNKLCHWRENDYGGDK